MRKTVFIFDFNNQLFVPEPPPRGGGAARKMNGEKECGSPKSEPLGAQSGVETMPFVL